MKRGLRQHSQGENTAPDGNEHSPDEEGITTGVCARGSCAMMDEALQVQAMGPLPQAVLAKLDALYASDFGRVK